MTRCIEPQLAFSYQGFLRQDHLAGLGARRRHGPAAQRQGSPDGLFPAYIRYLNSRPNYWKLCAGRIGVAPPWGSIDGIGGTSVKLSSTRLGAEIVQRTGSRRSSL